MNFRKAVWTIVFSIVMVLGLIAQAGAAKDPLDSWLPRNPLPQLGNHLYGIACSGKTCVVVGQDTNPLPYGGGRILTSNDGYNWIVRKSAMVDPTTGAPLIPYAVAYGDPANNGTGIWIVVGNKGTILKSTNGGVTWTTVFQGYNDDDELRGVTYGKVNSGGLFVAVGKGGKVLTSPDGEEWTKEVTPTNSFMRGVAFGNGVFVAVGGKAVYPAPPLSTIMSSTDGKSWTYAGWTYSTSRYFTSVTYGNGAFVAVGNAVYEGDAYTNTVVSTNGTDWDLEPPIFNGQYSDTNSIAYGNGRFVAVSAGGVASISQDTTTWSNWSSGVQGFGGSTLYGVAFFKNIFIAIGSDSKLLTSADGQSWTERASLASNFLYGLAYGKKTYAAVGWSGKVLTSTDKVTWIEQKSKVTGSLFGITFGNGKFVAVGTGGNVSTSTNGTTWVAKSSGVPDALFGVAYGNNTFVAVGARGKIVTSTDGVTWKQRASNVKDFLYGISYVNRLFVAVGQNGRILSSSDGVHWTDNTPPYADSAWTPECLYGVTFGGTVFIAVGDNGRVLTSPDLITWTNHGYPWYIGYPYGLRAVTHADNNFVVLGNAGTIFVSAAQDASSWSQVVSGIAYSLCGMVYDDTNTLVTVGAYATILSSKYDDSSPSQWTSWATISTGTYRQLKAIASGHNTFVAVGEGGTVMTSKNGVTWDIKTLPMVSYLNGITYGRERFVAVGDYGGNARVFTSDDDGVTWNLSFPAAYFTPSNLYAVAYGKGRFLASGVDGIELLSVDGLIWSEEYLESVYDIKGIAFANRAYDDEYPCLGTGIYVMVGASNREFLTSSKPESWWMIRYAPFFPQDNALGFTGVAYGAGVFTVVGPKVKIGISENGGKQWAQVPLKDYRGTFDFTGITFGGNGTFTAVGTYGKILTSPDGKDWTIRRSGTTKDLYGMIYGASVSGNTYVAVGQEGTILQSGVLP